MIATMTWNIFEDVRTILVAWSRCPGYIPSGKLWQLWKITIFYGVNQRYFLNGHFQSQTVSTFSRRELCGIPADRRDRSDRHCFGSPWSTVQHLSAALFPFLKPVPEGGGPWVTKLAGLLDCFGGSPKGPRFWDCRHLSIQWLGGS